MRTIVQVEYRSGLLTEREEILQFLGCPVVSIFGSKTARQLDLSNKDVGVILIGHGAPWEERSQLIAHFKQVLPMTPVIASLRQSDKPFSNADFNCPADNPQEWVRLVTQVLAGIE
jgi:DNA-binding NtrC family response regulator